MKINFKRQETGNHFMELVDKRRLSPVTALGLMEDKPSDKKQVANVSKDGIKEIFVELDSLVGLGNVKRLIKEIYAFVSIQKRRQEQQLATEPNVLHMVFKGNPGTGKTTVARIIGRLFKELGVLQKGHVLEIERADLVGEYIGHTAQRTKDQLRKALGGVLFIDEAYSLARGGEKDFGKEAIDALVKAMEDNKYNIILILAGYTEEMDWFIKTNPGLRSRFPIHIDFPDYSINELMSIATVMLEARQYQLEPLAKERLLQTVTQEHANIHAGNARLVRNLIEKAIRRQAVRLMKKQNVSREELMLITKEDFIFKL